MIQPLSLYNRGTTTSSYVSDHKNCAQKPPGKRRSDAVAMLGQACACTGGGGGWHKAQGGGGHSCLTMAVCPFMSL